MADQEEPQGLALGLSLASGSGGGGDGGGRHLLQLKQAVVAAEPSLSLGLTGAVKREDVDGDGGRGGGGGVYCSAASSAADGADDEGCGRKKLRLTKEQSALLEGRFKEHSTLNTKQKAALARQLKLRPRQVEVWFQNRRARTKLKQTEVDCELLRRCCQTLTDENRRLHCELQHLRALHHHHHPSSAAAATLSVCPSCGRLAGAPASASRPAAKVRRLLTAADYAFPA